MAYREHGMWEVLEVLKRARRGESGRAIARGTGLARKTVGRYLRAAGELGWDRRGEAAADEALACRVVGLLKPGPEEGHGAAAQQALALREGKIKEWLTPESPYGRGLRLTKVHELLGREGLEVSYSSLYRFAEKRRLLGKGEGTVRMADTAPGEVAEVDFGKMGKVFDPQEGRERTVYALIVTLVYSRHQYVHLTHTQKVADLAGGLEEAWFFFGGVPARVVLDNLKAAVARPDRYDPRFQRSFAEYAEHRGFVIDAALPRSPKGKPHVERQVAFVRDSFFRGEAFLSLEHAQREAVRWCLGKAGTRVHGTTRRRPLEAFEEEEKPALKELRGERFDPPSWAEVKVHPDGHVRFGKALYSVPDACRGKRATVRGDSKLVRIYVEGQLVRTHPVQRPGGRSTSAEDIPPHKAPYAIRDREGIVRKAGELGESAGIMAARLLEGDFPWAKLRQVQKLSRLAGKYGAVRLDAACKRALAFDLINVQRVEKILLQALEADAGPDGAGPDGQLVQIPPRFMRDTGSFSHPRAAERE
jgi:transposase